MEYQNFHTGKEKKYVSYVYFEDSEFLILKKLAKKEIEKIKKKIEKLIEKHDETVKHERKIEIEKDNILFLQELIDFKHPKDNI